MEAAAVALGAPFAFPSASPPSPPSSSSAIEGWVGRLERLRADCEAALRPPKASTSATEASHSSAPSLASFLPLPCSPHPPLLLCRCRRPRFRPSIAPSPSSRVDCSGPSLCSRPHPPLRSPRLQLLQPGRGRHCGLLLRIPTDRVAAAWVPPSSPLPPPPTAAIIGGEVQPSQRRVTAEAQLSNGQREWALQTLAASADFVPARRSLPAYTGAQQRPHPLPLLSAIDRCGPRRCGAAMGLRPVEGGSRRQVPHVDCCNAASAQQRAAELTVASPSAVVPLSVRRVYAAHQREMARWRSLQRRAEEWDEARTQREAWRTWRAAKAAEEDRELRAAAWAVRRRWRWALDEWRHRSAEHAALRRRFRRRCDEAQRQRQLRGFDAQQWRREEGTFRMAEEWAAHRRQGGRLPTQWVDERQQRRGRDSRRPLADTP